MRVVPSSLLPLEDLRCPPLSAPPPDSTSLLCFGEWHGFCLFPCSSCSLQSSPHHPTVALTRTQPLALAFSVPVFWRAGTMAAFRAWVVNCLTEPVSISSQVKLE